MPSSLQPENRTCPSPVRRRLLGAGLAAATLPTWAAGDERVEQLLRDGSVVMAFRHALAPGTFDPPGFRLNDCSTQRNLSEQGREQARRIGAWFQSRGLQPASVRSSPWCRCIDTAQLAFGKATAWAALGSPRGVTESTGADHLRQLRKALQQLSVRRGQFEVWVTHMFVLSDLAFADSRSGEGLILQADADGHVRVLARLAVV